jgi:hypothetical protein
MSGPQQQFGLAATLFWVTAMFCPAQEAKRLPSREKFAAAVAKIEIGMARSKVLGILGKPDDVVTEPIVIGDRPGVRPRRPREIWCYGTDKHLGFPTLARVYIDTNGKVQYVCGNAKPAPTVGLFKEAELRHLLRLVHRAWLFSREESSPLGLIQAVNSLHRLEKRKVLAVIEEYLRVCSPLDSEGERALLLIRVLFEPPDTPGFKPLPLLGSTSPAPPTDRKACPRFPIILFRDIPISPVTLSIRMGPPLDPHPEFQHFKEHGRIRAKALRPPNNPLSVLDELFTADRWLKTLTPGHSRWHHR